MIIDSGEGIEASTLEVALIIYVASKVIEDPLNRTRVREKGEPILERQNMSQNKTILIPASHLGISGSQARNLTPIVHVSPSGGPVPQTIIAAFQDSLGKDGREGDRGDHRGGGRRHNKKCWEMEVVAGG